MTAPADLFADDPDPWEAPAPDTSAPGTSAPGTSTSAAGSIRPTRRGPAPNGWKAAALVLGGGLGGAMAASVVWCVALLGVIAAQEDDEDYLFDDYGPTAWDESDTVALTSALNANPVVQEYLGTVTGATLNEDRSYAADVEYDEWFYDVVGEHGTGLIRARFDTQEHYKEADLTLPDGTVLPLDLAIPTGVDVSEPPAVPEAAAAGDDSNDDAAE
ncbi:hypothetical protein [Alienimonas chondri]|uniref:Uncharacterized protein n=1 Tax=Alienimonas chondri TaxID=2681879 RepID=A0ABX1V9W5_9PLAN|nr:hypothetical protein [Alienimonas chondri]NNJ24853.1 hypothetical protein [Alienimonas chondri]